MKSTRRESLTESSMGDREVVDGDGDDGYYSAEEIIIPMGEESFIPQKSAINVGVGDANENYDNDISMHDESERRSSMTIHDISIDNDYSNDLDISIGGSLDDDESQEDLFQEDHQPQQYPPQQQRKKSFMKVLRTQESEMSLQSFTSINSFSSHQGGGERSRSSGDYHSSSLELGDLTFCTDDEVATLMYGEDEKDAKNENEEENGCSSATPAPTTTNLAASLPPSSTLGTGAFSTVRLAWRTTTTAAAATSFDDNPCAVHNRADRTPSTMSWSCQDDQAVAYPTSTQPLYKKRELVAVKIIQKSILKQIKSIQRGPNNRLMVHTAYDNIEREIATMKRLRHPNVVRLFEVIDSVESDRLYMVLEYVSLGEILSHVDGTDRYTRMRYRRKVRGLTSEGHFDETHAALYFVDILHGLAYLHRNRICHRDLKPENILLCASGIAKISDFGVAHIFEDEKLRDSKKQQQPDYNCGDIDGSIHHLSQHESDVALNMPSKYNTGMLKKTEGTWCFWSPEMCSSSISSSGGGDDESKGFSGYAADLWAAGVCLYIFTTGRLPFFSLSPSDLFQLIARAEVQYEGLGLSNELTDLLRKLLTKDPAIRAGVGDCLKHKFCAAARTKRIHELGSKFKGSERQIVLSKNDVDMALSVFKSQKHAPLVDDGGVMTNNNNNNNNNIIDPVSNGSASSSFPPAPSPSPSHLPVDVLPQAWDLRNDSNLTKSTIETSVEIKERTSSTRKLSRLSSTSVRLGKTMRNIFNYIRNVEVDNN